MSGHSNRIVFCIIVLLAFSGRFAVGDEPLSSRVSRVWLAGDKAEALALAEERLATNPRDLSALLIRLEYQTTFLKVDSLQSTIDLVREVAESTKGPEFQKVQPVLMAHLDIVEQLLPTLTPAAIDAELHKGFLPEKPITTLSVIRALEADRIATVGGNVDSATSPPVATHSIAASEHRTALWIVGIAACAVVMWAVQRWWR